MKLPLLKLELSRTVIVYCAVVAVVAPALLCFAFTRGTGEVRRDGVVYPMPVPYLSVQIGARENRTTFLTIGFPDLKTVYNQRGGEFGWGAADRGGGAFTIPSTRNKKTELIAATFSRMGGAVTVVEFFVNVW